MPSPEGERRRSKGRSVPEQGNKLEQEPPAYLNVAYFSGEHTAGLAYTQAQDAIYRGPANDLSVYRLMLQENWHVAVLGQTPPKDLGHKLQAIMDTGMPATLPDDILTYLNERRKEATKLGPWVEGHYRPGSQPL